MAGTPEDPPESDRFEEYGEIAVDGRPVFRIEQTSELSLSDIDDAAIALVLREFVKEAEESLEEAHGMDVESVLRKENPEVKMYNSATGDWEEISAE